MNKIRSLLVIIASVCGVGGFVLINIGFSIPVLRSTERFDEYAPYLVLLGFLVWVITGLTLFIEHKYFEKKEKINK